MFRMCGLLLLRKYGMHSLDTRNVPRVLTLCIKSYLKEERRRGELVKVTISVQVVNPPLHIGPFRWGQLNGTGVVDHHIDSLELVHGLLDSRTHLTLIADINNTGQSFATGRLN